MTPREVTAAKFRLLARAYGDNDLGPASVYRVLMYAVEKADATGRFWKKNTTIAGDIGIHRDTVIKALNKLTLGGYIERKGRHNGVGNSCNVYCIALDLGGALKAVRREVRRREKYQRQQTEKQPSRGSELTTPEVADPLPQRSSDHYTYISLPDNPSLEPLKEVAQQGIGKLVEDGAPIGTSAANLSPLMEAKKSAVAALGKGRFIQKDIELTKRLVAVPADARDALRRLEYALWAEDPTDEWVKVAA